MGSDAGVRITAHPTIDHLTIGQGIATSDPPVPA